MYNPIDSNWLVEGKKTEIFQDNFAKFHNAKFAIATSSCTASLHIACKLLDLKSDHEVLVPTFSWVTSASCVEYINAKIRFVDVNVDTYNIELNNETRWMFEKIAAAVSTVNAEHYRFDLMGITHAVQLLHYKASENGKCMDNKAAFGEGKEEEREERSNARASSMRMFLPVVAA